MYYVIDPSQIPQNHQGPVYFVMQTQMQQQQSTTTAPTPTATNQSSPALTFPVTAPQQASAAQAGGGLMFPITQQPQQQQGLINNGTTDGSTDLSKMFVVTSTPSTVNVGKPLGTSQPYFVGGSESPSSRRLEGVGEGSGSNSGEVSPTSHTSPSNSTPPSFSILPMLPPTPTPYPPFQVGVLPSMIPAGGNNAYHTMQHNQFQQQHMHPMMNHMMMMDTVNNNMHDNNNAAGCGHTLTCYACRGVGHKATQCPMNPRPVIPTATADIIVTCAIHGKPRTSKNMFFNNQVGVWQCFPETQCKNL